MLTDPPKTFTEWLVQRAEGHPRALDLFARMILTDPFWPYATAPEPGRAEFRHFLLYLLGEGASPPTLAAFTAAYAVFECKVTPATRKFGFLPPRRVE